MLVAIQLSARGLYLPPVFVMPVTPSYPLQTTISLPVQTAVWNSRAVGALVVLVAAQLSVSGLYLPPVLKKGTGVGVGVGPEFELRLHLLPAFISLLVPIPPQIIIAVPVQTAV